VGPSPIEFFGSITIDQVFVRKPSTEDGTCQGDSGGPMFVRRNGIEFVAAVTSFGDVGCHLASVSGRTDIFEAQICAFAGEAALGCGGNPLVPELCNNGIDDDGDSDIDCQDSQCGNDPVCRETLCDNGLDDNGNGLIDCQDATCATNPACAEICDNDQDDDGDGNIDCQDGDCIGTSACREVCDNDQDDDGDGKVDCQDVADCATNAACLSQTEGDCDDFSDNDSDGQTDCADADCADSPACEEAPAPPAEGCAVQPASSHGALAALFSLLSLAAFFARRRRF
jgi:MYXO-CTERM domain-containing protein